MYNVQSALQSLHAARGLVHYAASNKRAFETLSLTKGSKERTTETFSQMKAKLS